MKPTIYCCLFLFMMGCQLFFPNLEDLEEDTVQAYSFYYQGLYEKKIKNWENALAYFYTASLFDKQEPRILYNIAKCFAMLEENEKAKFYLQQAEEVARHHNVSLENNHLFYFDLGECYHSILEYEHAKRLYKEALRLFPEFKQAQIGLITLPNGLTPKLEILPLQ